MDEASDGDDAVKRSETDAIDVRELRCKVWHCAVTYKLPSKNVRQTATFCVPPICNLSTLVMGTVRMQMSPKRLMMPTPR
jgi:hypothetical protein